jgi:hypothetical protein
LDFNSAHGFYYASPAGSDQFVSQVEAVQTGLLQTARRQVSLRLSKLMMPISASTRISPSGSIIPGSDFAHDTWGYQDSCSL